jgi:hypothetical protein
VEQKRIKCNGGQCVINGKLGYKYSFLLHLADNLHEKRGRNCDIFFQILAKFNKKKRDYGI